MERNKSEKKEHILGVAEHVFAHLGYEGASTRYLAQEAGVNMAMLNYYFGSKDGLLQAVLKRRLNCMSQALKEVQEQNISSWEKLTQAIDIYLNRVLGNNYYYRIMHRELSLMQRSETVDFIMDNARLNTSIFKEIIQEGVQTGSFRQVDIEMTIASILGVNHYITNSHQIASHLLQVDTNNAQVLEKDVKCRMKNFLNDFLQAYLVQK